jgi:LacI family transcriptional regulator
VKEIFMQVTLEEIAKATGFSVPTVSRALTNNDYPVSPATRRRILEVAEALGYKPNLSARSLRTARTNTIGIIVDNLLSPFVPAIVLGIEDHLKAFDYLGLIVNTDFDPTLEKEAISTLVNRPVDGIIFVESLHAATRDTLEQINKPTVFVHRLFGSSVKNSVVPDDRYGSKLAINHLAALGHRRIAYINGPERWHSAKRRLAGYKEALEGLGIGVDPALIQPGDWELIGGYEATQRLLEIETRPTAIFAANDLMALGAIYAIQDAGLKIPDNIAVVGYDDRDFARIFRPKITTVSLPVYEMGTAAAKLILKQLTEGQQDEEEEKVKGQLFIRESCGADETQRTKEELNAATTARRILLNKQPDD